MLTDASEPRCPTGKRPGSAARRPGTRKLPPIAARPRRRPGAARRRHPRPGRLRRPEDAGVVLAAYPSLTAGGEARRAEHAGRPRRLRPRRCWTPSRRRRCPRPTCRPRSSASCATSRTRTSTSRSPRSWGIVRNTPADRQKLIAEWKKKLTAAAAPPDLALGRAMFAKTCQQCHTLLRRRRQGRPGHHRLQPRQPRLPAGEHPRPQRRHPEGIRGDASSTSRAAGSSPASSSAGDASALTVVTANEMLTIADKRHRRRRGRATCR